MVTQIPKTVNISLLFVILPRLLLFIWTLSPGQQVTDVSTAQVLNALSQRYTDITQLAYLSDRALREEDESRKRGETFHTPTDKTVLSVQRAFRMNADEAIDRLTAVHHQDDLLQQQLLLVLNYCELHQLCILIH